MRWCDQGHCWQETQDVEKVSSRSIFCLTYTSSASGIAFFALRLLNAQDRPRSCGCKSSSIRRAMVGSIPIDVIILLSTRRWRSLICPSSSAALSAESYTWSFRNDSYSGVFTVFGIAAFESPSAARWIGSKKNTSAPVQSTPNTVPNCVEK